MSAAQLTAGDEVYLDNGAAVIFVTRQDDGYIVRSIVREADEENPPAYGRPHLVNRVFATPPEEKYHAAVAKLRMEEADLQAQVNALLISRRDAQQAHDKLLQELSTRPDLTRLLDFMSGRITHVLIATYSGIAIRTFEEAFASTDENSRREPGFKLLTLFGNLQGQVSFHMNHYRDGSGSNVEIYPCLSAEDALRQAQAYVDAKIAAWRLNPNYYWGSYMGNYVVSGRKLGVVIPADVTEFIARKGIEELEKLETKQSTDLQGTQAKLAALRGDTA